MQCITNSLNKLTKKNNELKQSETDAFFVGSNEIFWFRGSTELCSVGFVETLSLEKKGAAQ